MSKLVSGKSYDVKGDSIDADKDTKVNGAATSRFSQVRNLLRPTTDFISAEKARFAADEIRAAIQALIMNQQLEENQAELARISNLLPNFVILASENRLQNLALAVAALSSAQPNSAFSSSVRSDCDLSVLRSQRGIFRFVYRIAGSSSVSATRSGLIFSALGMLFASLIITLIMTMLKDKLNSFQSIHVDWVRIFLMVLMAAAGSFVSVLSRLSQFSSNKGFDAFLVPFTGFFKPWVGVVFGVFLFFVLDAKLINLPQISGDTNSTSTQSLYLVFAFIGGFSERLVSDFIGKTENRILGPSAEVKVVSSAKPA